MGVTGVRGWLLGAAAVALLAPAAQAQTGDTNARPAASAGEVAKEHYLVFFAWNRATLNAAGRVVVAEAAADFQRSGHAQVEVVGHTDASGSSAYNQKLSLRRADAVRAELERLGVPAAAIVTSGRGQDDLLVPTADHVGEPQNRRVEIIVPQPPPQAPVAATPEQPLPPPVASPPSLAAFAGPALRPQFRRDGPRQQQDPERPARPRASPAAVSGRRRGRHPEAGAAPELQRR